MAPTPQRIHADNLGPNVSPGEEIVISGISGLFPKSDNVVQFMENLYNHVDMVEPNNSKILHKHHDMPEFMGKIHVWNKFDAQFFKVAHGQVRFMDGLSRKFLEQTYAAIFDAGINPISLAGGKVGVFSATSYFDQASINFLNKANNCRETYAIIGSNKSMYANRISYWLDSKATSYAVDQTCASFTVCLEHAYWCIRNGLCDAAIVTGGNQCIEPMLSINLKRAGVINLDGKTKCFDKTGDGFVRSEVCGTIFLQKAKDAKRIYCEVYYVKEKFFMSPNLGLSFSRKTEDLEQFLQEFYNEINVSPDIVEYIEANAPGIAEADGNELEAIANVFAKNKTVKVGSVKSNMGHGEGASGLSALIKICLAYQTGKLPANLHYCEPQDNILAVKDGTVQVVTENITFNRGHAALSSFSLSGVNTHVLLKSHYKTKDSEKYKSSISHLVLASARTEPALNKLKNHLKNKLKDPEEIALIHNFYKLNIPGHTIRGYVILGMNKNNETMVIRESSDIYQGDRRPVWFVYSGMGSQWPTMGAAFMTMPVFAAAIKRCDKVLKPKGVDIVRILTDPDKTIFDNILHSFVGIAAIQIALTDILEVLGIVPDNIIGHSLGELGCAYADGCLTTDEIILASYYRGRISLETIVSKGAMAAVGLGYKDILPICPPEIDIACRNSPESCTISGPFEGIKKFVSELKSRGVFTREVNTGNIAYHSRYIAHAGALYLSTLKELIATPKMRSKKWLSTSVLPENWNKPEAQFCSGEYLINNLLSSVYFEEAAAMIPSNAIVIEISPHGLMQPILRRSLESCIHVPLTKRDHPDSVTFFLESIGKLYEAGLNPKIEALYPKVEFPVSTETPILSHLVEWEHSDDWPSKSVSIDDRTISCAREVILSVYDVDWSFMQDHVRDGIAVVPEAVVLFLVWETLGMYQGVNYKHLSVCFTDVEFYGAINIREDAITLNINILKGSGKFQVTFEDLLIVGGYVRSCHVKYKHRYVEIPETVENDMQLNSKDVYTMMSLRGHSYGPRIQTIRSCNFELNKAQVKWNGEWVMFLDSLLQLSALATDHNGTVTPVMINQLFIDTKRHIEFDNDGLYVARVVNNQNQIIRCGGVKIKNIFQQKDVPKTVRGLTHHTAILKKPNGLNLAASENTSFEDIKLGIKEYGDIDKLEWVKFDNIRGSVSVKVSYTGISLSDCQRAVGSITDGVSFGMDYSGINTRNEKVMGVVYGGAMATSVEGDLDLMWPVPEYWSMEDAATVPLPYLLVYYTLARCFEGFTAFMVTGRTEVAVVQITIRIDIQRNRNILVMDGANTLGQAFISVCIDLSCNVFATVANNKEKELLINTFPTLKEENIINYRTTSTYNTIVSNTAQFLCDVVINCGFGGSRETGLKCVGLFGIFLDIIEVPKRKVLGMDCMSLNRNIYLVHLPNLFKPENMHERKFLQARISEGIAKGIVRPLSRVVFSPTDISKAFRLCSSNNYKGRVTIDMKKIQEKIVSSRETLYSSGTYIVISNSILGIELVDRLVTRGAKHVVLNCAIQSGYLQYKINSWSRIGVIVSISSAALQTEESCSKLIKQTVTKGPINGIFIVEDAFANANRRHPDDLSTVNCLNKVLSEIYPDLRSFAVIALTSTDNKDEDILLEFKDLCQRRRQNNLSSVVFEVALNKKQMENIEDVLMNTSSEMISMMFKSLESAIEQVRDTKFLMNNFKTSVDFMQKITKILGIKDIRDSNAQKTLKDYGISNIFLQEIKVLILNVYGMNYSLKHLQQMTFLSLILLYEKYNKKDVDNKIGLDAFFSYVDDDECRASEPTVLMSTAANKHIFDETRMEIDSQDTYLYMLPGFGGHHEIFTSLSKGLKIPTVTFQIGTEFQGDTISTIAKRIMNNIKQTFNLNTKFYILGYSFGVTIALELASLMEKEGHTGIIYCMDSSPDALKIQLDEYIGKLNDEELQNEIIVHMYSLISGRNKNEFGDDFKSIETWTAKVDLCVAILKRFVSHSHEYIKCIIQGLYDKIKATRNYKPNLKLQSEIVLLKGTRNHISLTEDYGLGEYSIQPVRMFDIDSDFVSAPQNCRIANIVNSLLEPRILEQYKQKNLCDTYVIM